jgi:hypothetical protein
MNTLTTPEASARHILSFGKQRGTRLGEGFGWQTLIGPFSVPGWRIDNPDARIAYAVEQGRLKPAGTSFWLLTEEGFAVT